MSSEHQRSGPASGRNVSLKVISISAVVVGLFVAWSWLYGGLDGTSGPGRVSLMLIGVTVMLLVLSVKHQLRASARGQDSSLDDTDWFDVTRRLLVWLGLTLVSLVLLYVAFALAFAAGFAGGPTPTSAYVALALAVAGFVASLVPLFLQTPTGLKVFGCVYVLIVGILILSAGW